MLKFVLENQSAADRLAENRVYGIECGENLMDPSYEPSRFLLRELGLLGSYLNGTFADLTRFRLGQ
jgi:hypothetical protein